MLNDSFTKILKNSTLGCTYNRIIMDDNGKPIDYIFLESNPAFDQMLGKEPGSVQGKKVSEVSPEVLSDSFDWVSFFGVAALTGQNVESEAYSDALRRWFHLSVSSPEQGHFVVVSFDITKAKTTEQELEKSREESRQYIENAPDGIFVADSRQKYVDVNAAACRMLGYTAEELTSMYITDLIPPEDDPGHKKTYKEILQKGKASRTTRLRKKDGTIITASLEVVRLPDSKVLAFSKDITEQQRLESEKNKFFTAFKSTDQPILITDPDGTINAVNDAFIAMYGYDRDELIGKNPRMLNPGRDVYENLGVFPFEYAAKFRDLWVAVQNPAVGTWKGELINRKKNGSLVWIDMVVNAVYDNDGYLKNIIGCPVDTTSTHEKAHKDRVQMYQTIADMAEMRDDDTGNHMKRVGLFAKIMAKKLGFPQKYCEDIEVFAPLHDLGKVGILDSILRAPRKLSFDEFNVIKTHTILGHNIVKGKPEFEMAAAITLCHHEKFDGTGYPNGLGGKHIPRSAQITAVCDVYDALRSKRPYKDPWSHEKTVTEILNGSGTHFDPDVVQGFAAVQERFNSVYQELMDVH